MKSKAISSLLPYMHLARLHRPVGTLLLLFPCWWGIALMSPYWEGWSLGLFAIGSVVMRGAGCTLNDLWDRSLDPHVERTKMRPLACGALHPLQAFIFFILQTLIGLWILLQLPPLCWMLGVGAFILLIIYPLMKRITYWPQLVLGLAFNSGVWIGAASLNQALQKHLLPLVLLYGAGIFWTLAYDTIYAVQDQKDDQHIGVKSTALLFGAKTPLAVGCFYGGMLGCLAVLGIISQKSLGYFYSISGLAGTIFLYAWWNPVNADSCQQTFVNNIWIGLLIYGILALT